MQTLKQSDLPITTQADYVGPGRWRSGQPYRYPIPNPEGDPWDIVLTPLIRKDKLQCTAWKEQIQSILVVASLFSGVATTCLVFNSIRLSPDPNDRIILLLTRLVADTENPNNISAHTPIPDWEETKNNFRPPAAFVGLNDCLFTSLYLSLTVVLIGVSALQWIWEHEQYPDLTPKQHFAILQMRKEALDKWWVPQIIQILPSFLLVALVAFLVALWHPNNAGIYVFVQYFLQYFSLFFFTFTTFLPIFQEYLLYLPRLDVRREIPVPCPYRSNQSRFCRQLFTYNKFTLVLLSPFSLPLFILYYLWVLIPMTYKFFLGIIEHRPQHRRSQTFGRVRPDFHSTWTQKTWTNLDLDFLQVRWTYFKDGYNISPQQQKLTQTYVAGRHFNEDLLYDAIRGLQSAAVSQIGFPSVIYAAYHCFQEISDSILSSCNGTSTTTSENFTDLNKCFQAVLAKEDSDLSHFPACSLSSTIQHPSLDILKDENTFLYLKAVVDRSFRQTRDGRQIWPASYSNLPQVVMTKHFAELRIRVKAYFYSELSEQIKVRATRDLDLAEPWDISILPLFDSLVGQGDDDEVIAFSKQYLGILAAFFTSARNPVLVDQLGGLLTHRHLINFIMDGARVTHRYLGVTLSQGDSESHEGGPISLVFDVIQAGLDSYLERPLPSEQRPDLLFYAASVYIRYIFLNIPPVDRCRIADPVEKIMWLLFRCKQQLGRGNVGLEKKLDIEEFSGNWWEFLDTYRVSRTRQSTSSVYKLSAVQCTATAAPLAHEGPHPSAL